MKKMLIKLIRKHFLKAPKFKQGELVKHVYNDVVYETVGTYYSEELQPILFIRDSESKLAAVDQGMYEAYKGSVNV